MPFGLRNAAQSFQRFIDQVTRGLYHTFCYVDDLLIAYNSPQEHLKHLNQLFQRLDEYGIIINPDKSVFGVSEVEFLGHLIQPQGISPLPERVEAILKFPQPTTVTQLRRFIGMVNFYRRFISEAVHKMQSLHDLLIGKKKKQDKLSWSEGQASAFKKTLDAITSTIILQNPVPDAITSIVTDSSDTAVAGVLQQRIGQHWKPLAFFSRKLQPAETRYSAFDKELLAVYLTVRHFRSFLEGRSFHVLTDHKPLVHAMASKPENRSPRQARHLSYVAEFTSDIRYIKGEDNVAADALSRADINQVEHHGPVDYDSMVKAQQEDPELQKLQSSDTTSLQLQDVTIPTVSSPVICDFSTGSPRPYVPEPFRKQVFSSLHNLAHPGIKASARLICSRFVWPKMHRDIKLWCTSCLACQKSKIHRHTNSPPGTFAIPSTRFDNIHLDIVGPLPMSDGSAYILTCIDRFSRWPEAFPICNITAAEVAKAFVRGWISRFGVPTSVTTDRGRQLDCALWRHLTSLLGTRHLRTCAYRHQANGLIERFHRQLKSSLKAYNDPTRWSEHLPIVLLGLRNAVKEDLQASPAELVYGTTLRLPGEFLFHPAVDCPIFQTLASSIGFATAFNNYNLFQHVTYQRSLHSFILIFLPAHMCSSAETQL
ncbi:Uncharacterised protein r2_g3179 [Pycnogonum litorale]